MGALLSSTESNYLLSDLHSPLDLLSNCKFHKGNYSQIIMLQQKLAKFDTPQGFFLPTSRLKSFFSHSPIEGRESIIQNFFLNKKHDKVNMLEVIGGLIIYSACTIEQKVLLALEVFDFDGNQVITKDEMEIMCISFLRSIGIMTRSGLYDKQMYENLASEAFFLADSNPDGMITHEELEAWVKGNPTLTSLLQKYQPKKPVPNKRKSLIQSYGFELVQANQRHSFDANYKVRVSLSPKKSHYRQSMDFSINQQVDALSSYINQFGNAKKKVVCKDLHDHFLKNPEYKALCKELSKKFRMQAEIGVEEVMSLYQRKNKRATTVSGNVKREVNSEQITVKELAVLGGLFKGYDLDGDGFLSLIELKKALREKFTLETIEKMFIDYDSDKDGKLDFQDFVRLYRP